MMNFIINTIFIIITLLLLSLLYMLFKAMFDRREGFNLQHPIANRVVVDKIHKPETTEHIPVSIGEVMTLITETSDEQFTLVIKGIQNGQKILSEIQVDRETFESYCVGDKLKDIDILAKE